MVCQVKVEVITVNQVVTEVQAVVQEVTYQIHYKVVAQVLEVGDGVCLNEQFNDTVWLSIRANNGMTVERDWRDYQAIKNDLVSPDRQAIEIYPKESKLVDTVNVFHLWVLPEDIEIPVGYQYRDVDYTRADQRECLNANEEK